MAGVCQADEKQVSHYTLRRPDPGPQPYGQRGTFPGAACRGPGVAAVPSRCRRHPSCGIQPWCGRGFSRGRQTPRPAQKAVADAITRSVTDGVIPEELIPDIAITANVFVHPDAVNARRVHINNFRAVRHAIRRAIEGRQNSEEIKARKDSARHPFAYNP